MRNLAQSVELSQVVLVEPDDDKMKASIQKIYKKKYPKPSYMHNDLEVLVIGTRTKQHVTVNREAHGGHCSDQKTRWLAKKITPNPI